MQTLNFVVACLFKPCAYGDTCVGDECICADGYDGIICENSELLRPDFSSYWYSPI